MKMATGRKPKAQASFEDEYASLLREYGAGTGEAALGRAYELGRRAFTERKSLVEIASLHHQTLQGLIREEKDEKRREDLLRAGGDFFAECLSPYEMAHRGFQDAVWPKWLKNCRNHCWRRSRKLKNCLIKWKNICDDIPTNSGQRFSMTSVGSLRSVF